MRVPTSIKGAGYGEIHDRIFRVLLRHPDGITITALRSELELGPTEQQHLDRRVRDLDKHYYIDRKRRGGPVRYLLIGERPVPLDASRVTKKLRAEILHLAGGRCQMCGRTVAEDHVKLHVDHRIPRDWGGTTTADNLWALCSECNEGKRNLFASIIDPRVKDAVRHPSVHVRLGELLKAYHGEWIPKRLLALVGSMTHDDWEKRLRELREIGWEYEVKRRRVNDRTEVFFRLVRSAPWPENPASAIREAERKKGKKR